MPVSVDEAAVRALLKEYCEIFGGQSAWAAKHGVSPQYVCDVLKGKRAVSASLADKLGLRRVIKFERKDGR